MPVLRGGHFSTPDCHYIKQNGETGSIYHRTHKNGQALVRRSDFPAVELAESIHWTPPLDFEMLTFSLNSFRTRVSLRSVKLIKDELLHIKRRWREGAAPP